MAASDSSIRSARSSRVRTAIDLIASIAMIAAASAILWSRFVAPYLEERAKNPLPSRLVSLGDSGKLKGDAQAKVAIIEYSDFQCPFCGNFSRFVLPTIETKYVATGKVRVAFRNFPLTNIHPNAATAARAAACAARDGKFWPMPDWLFANQSALSLVDVSAHAATVGLPNSTFSLCMSREGGDSVAADVTEAMEFKINSTPTFLVGSVTADGRVRVSRRLTGSQEDGELGRVLDKLLK